jgi:hypothetical protein
VINIFAGGRSASKVFLFLFYLLFLAVLAIFLKQQKRLVSVKQKIWFLVSVIVGYALNFFSWIFLVKKFNMKLSDWALFFNQSEISSSGLLHNHNLKGCVGLVLKFLGFSGFENLDAGTAFLDILPTPLFLFAIIVIIFLLFWAVYFFTKSYDPENKFKYFYLFFYAIITFSLIKNIVDGGIFNFEAFVSLAFFVLLLFGCQKKYRIATIVLLGFYLLLNILFYIFGFFDQSSAKQDFLMNLVSTLAYAALLSWLAYVIYRKKINRLAVLILILTLGLLFFPFLRDFSLWRYDYYKITPGNSAILATYNKIENDNYIPAGQVGALLIYKFTSDNTVLVKDIIEEQEILDNFYPLVFPYVNCLPHGLPDEYHFDLIAFDEIDFSKNKNSNVSLSSSLIKRDLNYYLYNVEMKIKPCLPRHINVIDEVLSEIGAQKVILLNAQRL